MVRFRISNTNVIKIGCHLLSTFPTKYKSFLYSTVQYRAVQYISHDQTTAGGCHHTFSQPRQESPVLYSKIYMILTVLYIQ